MTKTPKHAAVDHGSAPSKRFTFLSGSAKGAPEVKGGLFVRQAYNLRSVLGLLELPRWTAKEERIHLQHNRILQPGFMHRNPKDVLADAKLVGVKWLTDCCCPSISSAMMLHIAKEMVVNYKINETELNETAHRVYNFIIKNHGEELAEVREQVKLRLDSLMLPGGRLNNISLKKQALMMLNKNEIEDPTDEQVSAAVMLVIDIERKKILDKVMSKFVKKHLRDNAGSLGLKLKSVYKIGESHDYSFLGAAGSGKSTIAKQYFSDEERADHVVIATDNYRAFTMPNTVAHEDKATQDVFTRTQDFSYMVKELVQMEINESLATREARPNVICDCTQLDSNMHALLAQGKTTSVIAAYAPAGYEGIAERAIERAERLDAAPADKGRYVETTSLLGGHADASERLLSSIPEGVLTAVYDTSSERATPLKKIAEIDSKAHVVEIDDLRMMSGYLNKKNINTAAINQVDLIYRADSPLNLLSTHAENKAKAIIDLVPGTKFKPPYTVKLKDSDGNIYAELVPETTRRVDGVKLNVLNRDIFIKKSLEDSIAAGILRAIFRQVQTGSIEDSFLAAIKVGDNQSFKEMWEALINEKTVVVSRRLT